MLEDVATLLGSCEQLKAMVDSSSSSGVGTDMRNRVDHLLKRVRMLKQSADRAAHVAGGRLPSQLIGPLKALQREHISVENIVRLATQAGPVLIEQESSNEENSDLAVGAQEGNSSLIYEADTVDVELAQGQENETHVEVLSGPKYVMSTPFSEGSFKVTAVRAEIERRVMEQLLKKQRQSIFDSKQDVTKERNSKSMEFQKVSGVKQRSLGDKSDVEDATQTGKSFRPLMVDAQQVYYSTESESLYKNQKAELETRRGEGERGRTISLELHEQMGRNFEDALSDVRHQLSDVTNDLKEREDNLQALKKKLMDEQSEILEKINELSGEVTKRLTAEQLSNTLEKVIFDMEADLKGIQSQLVALGSDINMTDKIMAGWRGEHEKSRQELQAGILRLEGRLHQREGMLEGFNPQSVLAELGSVKAKLTALQQGRVSEQSQMADWRTTVEHFERSLLSNAQQIRTLTSEVECRVREGEVKDELKKVLEAVEKQSRRWQEPIDCIHAEQARSAANLGLLQEEWKTQRKEVHTQIEDVKGKLIFLETTQNQGPLKEELSHIKDKLNELQEAEKHGKSLNLEAQQQMMGLEAKGLSLQDEWKAYRRELQTQIEDVKGWEITGVLTEIAHIKNKLSELQEEHKHAKSLDTEAQQQMMGLEGKKLDLQEEWKSHRKDLQIQIEDVKDKLMLSETTQNWGVLTELSNIKDRLCDLQEEQKHDRSLLLEAHEQMVVSEGKGLDLQEEWNSYRRDLQAQIEDMKDKLVFLETTQNQAVLKELSHIKDKLGVLQEEQKHVKSLVLEAQQQMVLLEGKGIDLLKRMSEDAEAQKQDLREEVRTLVNELLKNPRGSMQESLAMQEPQATDKDAAPHTGNLVNSYALSSELSDAVSANDQPEATTFEGAQQVPDKERASLEVFFSVMGQLIREELKKMDRTSAKILPSADLHESGESTPVYPETDGESQRQSIILQYDSSWKRAFIHYCADNARWTEAPGVPMQEASNTGGKYWKEFRIRAARLEFVVTDGQGNWDRAPNGHNYLVERPGIFELGAGILKAVSTC